MNRRWLILLALAVGLPGCANGSSSTSSPSTTINPPTASAPAGSSTTRPTVKRPPARKPARSHHSSRGLRYSTASADQVQPQPAAGSCHASRSGLASLPDPRCTPGALNPAVTQATIQQTICVRGYTKTIRPAESITEPEKQASMAAYGDTGSMSDYEYDHLVSLELGGAANDPRNLWPEPGSSPNPKDTVENHLHDLVCSGQMPLATAQRIIATNWVAYARSHETASGSGATTPAQPAPSPAPSQSAPALPSGRVHCRDFATHAAAQQWFEAHGGSASHDVARLDANHNGIACEDLP